MSPSSSTSFLGDTSNVDVNPGVSLTVLMDLLDKAASIMATPSLENPLVTIKTRKVVESVVMPFVKSRGGNFNSYVEALEDPCLRGPPDFYVSHAWGMSFSGLVQHVVGMGATLLPDRDPSQIFVWVDFLCRKHPKGGDPSDPNRMVHETQAAIASANGPTLLIMDGNADVFALSWIQYEIWCTAVIKGSESLRMLCEDLLDPQRATDLLAEIDPKEAHCVDAAERAAIVAAIEARGGGGDGGRCGEEFRLSLCLVLLEAAKAEEAEMRELSAPPRPPTASSSSGSGSHGEEGDSAVPPEYLANALHKHGIFALACGRMEEAEEVYAEACKLMIAARGNETDGLCSTCFLSYAEVLAKRRKWSEAEPLYAKALPVQQCVEGPTHPDSRRAAKQYAAVLEALGKRKEADAVMESAGGRHLEEEESEDENGAPLNLHVNHGIGTSDGGAAGWGGASSPGVGVEKGVARAYDEADEAKKAASVAYYRASEEGRGEEDSEGSNWAPVKPKSVRMAPVAASEGGGATPPHQSSPFASPPPVAGLAATRWKTPSSVSPAANTLLADAARVAVESGVRLPQPTEEESSAYASAATSLGLCPGISLSALVDLANQVDQLGDTLAEKLTWRDVHDRVIAPIVKKRGMR